ncbi:Probable enoyl-CoA hydratase 1 [Rothia dentocariosa]|uniref:Probable enoyl-CoA hydratase 1 n=1 Tax=Rothia dentocariosa TaxID=2047 RepID=A0A448UWV7_9MICC|nr:Probable enoyl-CoA hydratase 1 [Rothia dentocariosa]
MHGAYLLSLAITFAGQLLPAEGTSMLVNAGVSAARFRSAVPVDSQVCGSASIVSAEDFGDATLAEIRVAVHVKGQSKPATTATVRMVLHD